MQTECITKQFAFAPVEKHAVVAGFDGGTITSDAGALLLGLADRAIGLIERFARCFVDGRRPELIEHEVRTLVGQRVLALALGYEGPERPRRTAPRSGDGGVGRQAQGAPAEEMRGGGRQVDAQPARTEPSSADALSQGQPPLRQITCTGWVRPSSMLRAALRVFSRAFSPSRMWMPSGGNAPCAATSMALL